MGGAGGEVRAVHEEVKALQAALALERGAHAQSLTEMRAVREDVKNVQAALEQSARGESLDQLREEMRQEAAAATDEVERKNAATVAAAIEAQAKKTQGTLDALARGLNEFGPSLIAQHEEGFADLRQELLARQAVADTTMQALAVAIRERQAETGAVDEKTKQMLHLANHTIGALDATKADTQALTERLAVLEVAQSDVSSTTVDEAMAALNQEIAEISASLGVAISALSSEGVTTKNTVASLETTLGAAVSGQKEELGAQLSKLQDQLTDQSSRYEQATQQMQALEADILAKEGEATSGVSGLIDTLTKRVEHTETAHRQATDAANQSLEKCSTLETELTAAMETLRQEQLAELKEKVTSESASLAVHAKVATEIAVVEQAAEALAADAKTLRAATATEKAAASEQTEELKRQLAELKEQLTAETTKLQEASAQSMTALEAELSDVRETSAQSLTALEVEVKSMTAAVEESTGQKAQGSRGRDDSAEPSKECRRAGRRRCVGLQRCGCSPDAAR